MVLTFCESGQEQTYEIASISVIGLGLLGGSIARAVKENYPDVKLSALDADPTSLNKALEQGVIDNICTDPSECLEISDFIIIATPSGSSVSVLDSLLSYNANKRPVITDVCSVKSKLCQLAASHKNGSLFVGSHPMAGSELSGFSHSMSTLFKGASVIICPHRQSDEKNVSIVENFWMKLGGLTERIEPELHDRMVAASSHVPHICAAALVRLLVSNLPDTDRYKYLSAVAGKGFIDMTRIASGCSSLWADILLENREIVNSTLSNLIRDLEQMKAALVNEDHDGIEEFLDSAREERNRILK